MLDTEGRASEGCDSYVMVQTLVSDGCDGCDGYFFIHNNTFAKTGAEVGRLKTV